MDTRSRTERGEGESEEAAGQAAERDEERLVARAQGGDHEAFALLVERHLPHVWAVVWRILRHHEDTEDVVQDAFLAAFRAIPRYRGEARLSTWLHRIAVTRALNHLDRKEEKMRRAVSRIELQEEALDSTADGSGGWLLRATPSPLQALEGEELRRRLADCLSRLPAPWRAVLTLRDVDALSYGEIARMAGLALGTVRSRLARARAALRQCVAGEV